MTASPGRRRGCAAWPSSSTMPSSTPACISCARTRSRAGPSPKAIRRARREPAVPPPPHRRSLTICCTEGAAAGARTGHPRHPPWNAPLPPGAGVARLLLVEDDPNVLMLLEHVLRGAGHDVDLASTVRQAGSPPGARRDDLLGARGTC